MRSYLPLALRSPAFAARGLEALEPLWMGARVTGLKPCAMARLSGDPERARDIYAGHFRLEGQSLDCRGRSVFALLPPSPAFAASLHGFGWLGDLQGSGRALDRVHARALVADWLARSRHHPAITCTGPVRAQRLTAWVKAAPFLLDGASETFTQRFFSGLTTEIRRMLLPRLRAADRQACAWALAHAVAGLSGLEALETLARHRLTRAMAHTFHNGMPPSRNGAELAASWQDAADLRAGFAIPMEPLETALAHMTLSDGSLARFQGADVAQSPVAPAASDAALLAGFARLGQGQTTLLLDAGAQTAAASLLAFEMTCESGRIITNCGFPAGGSARLRQAAARLGAHSAPCLGTLEPTSTAIEAECGMSPQGAWCTASHAGFAGYETRRSLFLAGDGRNLRGQDELIASPGAPDMGPFILRFHLDPATDARLAEDGASVLLAVGLQIWNFTAKGAQMALEESVGFAGRSAPAPAMQITLAAADVQGGARINWALRRVA